VKGEGLEQETVESLVEKFGTTPFFTANETEFVSNEAPD
jgi:hypothetical protein